MPRRNRAKGRRPQAQRGGKVFMPTTGIAIRRDGLVQRTARPNLLPMVEAAGVCPTGKIRYGTPEDAQEALDRAHYNRKLLNSPIVEERYYPMEGDAPCSCGGYHLTSQPRRVR